MNFDNYYTNDNILESKIYLRPRASFIIENIIDCVSNKIPISFSKYGDGEYLCAVGESFINGHNCDYDNYTEKLSNSLKESFIYMTTKTENAYIGMWENDEKVDFWTSLVDSNINWAQYHTFIIDFTDFDSDIFNRKLKMYKTIQESSLKKYIICNPLLLKSKILFNATSLIHVPFQNWFDEYFDTLMNLVCQEIGDNEQPIVITCCGMSAKVLIAELHKKYPKGIFLDNGSAIDFLCTKRDSRGRLYNYDHIYNSFSSILPKDWHDSKFENLYTEAQKKMGLHM